MIIDRVIYDTLKLHSFPSDLKSSSFILFPFYQHSSKKKNNNYKKQFTDYTYISSVFV